MKEVIDIGEVLRSIVGKTVEAFESDFDDDMRCFRRVIIDNSTHRTFIWGARKCGTFRADCAVIDEQDSVAYILCKYYSEYEENITPYIITLTEIDSGRIMGMVEKTTWNYIFESMVPEIKRQHQLRVDIELLDRS